MLQKIVKMYSLKNISNLEINKKNIYIYSDILMVILTMHILEKLEGEIKKVIDIDTVKHLNSII